MVTYISQILNNIKKDGNSSSIIKLAIITTALYNKNLRVSPLADRII